MNVKEVLESIEEISGARFPDFPEISELCKHVIMWERDNLSVTTPRYKEPYTKFLKTVERRWGGRINTSKERE